MKDYLIIIKLKIMVIKKIQKYYGDM